MAQTTADKLAKSGWILAHAQEPEVTESSRVKVVILPGSYRAEKTHNNITINLAAETEEGLLAVIEEWENDPVRQAVEAANAPAPEAEKPASSKTSKKASEVAA